MRYEAYTSLFAHGLRNAWLHTLYLSPHNFESVAYPLYIVPSTTSSILRTALSHTLRSAALHEIRKQAVTRIIDVESLYAESDKAFSALADLLGEDEWFFGENHPSLFDASVFAYTYLLLDENMGWKVEHERMGRDLREGRWENLIAHRGRIWKEYF